jgi:undecaprenyl phosphate-alpha-L-ara4FN deformylase
MARIALKVDVDTWRGTREGVPNLLKVLTAADVGASFLFSLGPDRTGRAITRVLRPGFLSKVSRTSVLEHYGLRTLLYGTLLPSPDIGAREAPMLRSVRDTGFEVGVHCWDHVGWQDRLFVESAAWAREQMQCARDRFAEIFGVAPRLHGAAGWQFNEAAGAAELALGFEFASDTRGSHPFQPVAADGRVIGPPQYPTTLPTLDELIGIDQMSADNVHQHVLAQTERAERDHVYTLHAELEGMRLLSVFERLVQGWRAQGHALVSLGAMREGQRSRQLPKHQIEVGCVSGRSGSLAVQGDRVDAGA